jgi:Nucleotide-diphospho-sugar transferase
MPKNAANSYLDKTFSRMMWFKMVSVYIACAAGFDVLFQDVDLIWLKDPIPFLRSLPGDMSFMDDGARTPRYTPFFVNSGFFFLKYNPKTFYFQECMMKCAASEIGYTHSHQAFMIRQLSEAAQLYGIDVFVLDLDNFPSGVQYHHNKGYMKKILAKDYVPYVFHMCWTDNRVDKVRYFKIMDMWYLPEKNQCIKSEDMLKLATSSKRYDQQSIPFACCQPTGWHSIGEAGSADRVSRGRVEQELFDKCHTASFTSAEWQKNCNGLFVHEKRISLEELEKNHTQLAP